MTEHDESFIEQSVSSRRFDDATEVVRAGLQLLEQREGETRNVALRLAAKIGFEELERRHVDFESDAELQAHLAKIAQSALSRIRSHRQGTVAPLRYRLRLSSAADGDLAELLRTTEERFGEREADIFLALVEAALADLAEDPERAGSRMASELLPDARLYHLRHSRERGATSLRTRPPRHCILYRRLGVGSIGVARFFDDAVRLPSHATGSRCSGQV